MTEPAGLRRVVEAVAANVRAAQSSGSFVPSAFATPLAVASFALATPHVVVVTATSTEAENLRDALAAMLLSDEIALWPAWDTHPLERVSPDNQAVSYTHLTLPTNREV